MNIKKFIIISILSFLLVIPALSQTTPSSKSDTITISKIELQKIITAEVSKAVDGAVAVAVKDASVKYEKQLTDKDVIIETKTKENLEKDAKINELNPMLYNAQQDYKNLQSTHLTTVLEVGGVCVLAGIVLGILAHNVIH
jgi:septal ring-binding cell division protein DamX